MRCRQIVFVAVAAMAWAAPAAADEAWALRVSARERAVVCHADGRVEAVEAEPVDPSSVVAPDGVTAAYVDRGAIYIARPGGGEAAPISPQGLVAAQPRWSPCSILFFGGRQAGSQIYGDEQVFIVPRQGEVRVFDVVPMVQRIEWVEPAGDTAASARSPGTAFGGDHLLLISGSNGMASRT